MRKYEKKNYNAKMKPRNGKVKGGKMNRERIEQLLWKSTKEKRKKN